jgi:hypothetical protein
VSQGGQYKGLPYSIGAAYLVDVEGLWGKFYGQLGLKLKPVSHPSDLGNLGGKWLPVESGPAKKSFDKLKRHFAKFMKSKDFPNIPVEKATSDALKLDRMSFYDYLAPEYSGELLKYIDAYCYSAMGGGIKEISAYSGVNFYSEITGDVYAFPGGNSYIAKRLVNKIDTAGRGRIRTGVSVYNIEQRGDRVITSFFPNDEPENYQSVESKAVIVSVPYFFIPNICRNLPDEQKNLMKGLQYGSYVVANFCFDKRVYRGAYDNWTPESKDITDFIVADHVSGGNAAKNNGGPFVITVYAPFRNPQEGRGILLVDDSRTTVAETLRLGLKSAIDFPDASLKEIRLTRYGHQILTSRTGIIDTVLKINKTFGKIIIAHSDGQGLPEIESAVYEGISAAKAVKGALTARARADLAA